MNDTTASAPGAPRRRKSRRGLYTVLALIVAAGGWYGVNKYLKSGDKEGEYLFATVTTGDIEDLVTATGTIEPRDYVDVGAQVSGQIEKLFVEVGDVVAKGDVLASIDATTAKARVESNQAQMLSSQTNLLTQQNNLEKAQRDYQRQVNLLADDATTKQQVLDAKTALDNAERSIITSKAQIAQQDANMRIEAQNLQYTQIIAPIGGTVMSIKVKEGQSVNASQNVPDVMRIADLSTMTVRSEVSEADVTKLYDGIPVYFTTLNAPNRRWNGVLKRVEPTPKTSTGGVVLYYALFDVQNEGNALKPSMTAQVFFVNAQARNALVVPMAALQQGQQIARELAAKEREKTGKANAAGAPGAAPNAAAGAGAGAPPAVANAGSPPGATEGGAAAPGQGNRQGTRNGQPGGNQRGGFNGGQGMSAEQREEMIARFRAGGGAGGQGFGGQRGGGGGFGGMGANGGGGNSRTPQRRNGTVMVKKADGTLEAHRVVVGVTDRVHGQVLEGLAEGDEVVVGKSEAEGAAATPSTPNNNNQGNRGGNFPGGGFPGGGGGFRPF